jgi:hypothetical protein
MNRSMAVPFLFVGLFLSPSAVSAQGAGASWSVDPCQGRLFLLPTARSLPRGRVNVTLIEFIMPFVSVGVTDDLTFAAGSPVLSGESLQEWWITGKYHVGSGRGVDTALAAGVIFGREEISTTLYGIVTAGSADLSATAGLGIMSIGGELADGAALTIGGDCRIGRNTKLITENHFLQKSDPISSLGVRFAGEYTTIDLGVAVVWEKQDPGPLPIIIIALNL